MPRILTSDTIRDEAIDCSIPMYLREGETKEGMMEKFKGNGIAAIQFLRNREFGEKPAPAENKEPKKQPKPKQAVKQPDRKVGAKQEVQTNQGGLF